MRNEQVLSPRTVDRIAEAPSAQRAAALRASVIQAIEALAAWSDRADDDAVPDCVLVLEAFAERLDDADRFVAEDQTRSHRVFAFDDVDVGAADRRDGDADHCFARTRLRFGDLFDPQFIHAAEHDGFHFVHCFFLCLARWQGSWNSVRLRRFQTQQRCQHGPEKLGQFDAEFTERAASGPRDFPRGWEQSRAQERCWNDGLYRSG